MAVEHREEKNYQHDPAVKIGDLALNGPAGEHATGAGGSGWARRRLDATMPRTSDDSPAPTVLYRAAVLPGLRVLILSLVWTFSVGPAVVVWVVVASAMDASRPSLRIIGLCAAALILALLASVLFVIVRGTSSAFAVSTSGVTVRGIFRTVHVPWHDVAVVRVDTRHMHRGQVLVVRHDGTRVGSPVTAARYAMRRGESTFDHGPQLLDVAIPVRAAIDAHQRYLRGEFS